MNVSKATILMKKSFLRTTLLGGKMTCWIYCSIYRLLFVLSSCGIYQMKSDFLFISLVGEKV